MNMKPLRALVLLVCALGLMSNSTFSAEKPASKLTCCQQAGSEGKECRHKCCAAAHKDGKSCQKCNPNKEDLKKASKKEEQKSGT